MVQIKTITDDVILEFIDDVLINPDISNTEIRKLFITEDAKYNKVYNWVQDNGFKFTKKHYDHFMKNKDVDNYPNLAHAAKSKKFNKYLVDGYTLEELIGKELTLGKLFINSYAPCNTMNLRELIPFPKFALAKIPRMGDIEKYSNVWVQLLTEKLININEANNIHDRWVNIGLMWADVLPPYKDSLFSNNDEENKFIDAWVKKMETHVKKGNLPDNQIAKYVNDEKLKMVKYFHDKYTGTKDFFIYDCGKADLLNHLGDSKAFKGFTGTITNNKEGEIIYSSYNHGVPLKETSIMKQINLNASYARAQSTADGGYQTKIFLRGTKNITISTKVKDCKTTKTIDIKLTKDNYKEYMHRYIMVGGKATEITYKNLETFLEKTVKMRTPLYCELKSGSKVCNTCVGEFFNNIGIRGIGSTTANAGSVVMMIEMKKFHDTSIKTVDVKVDDYTMVSNSKEFKKELISKLS